MFSYRDYLYALSLACKQQAEIYRELPRTNDYKDGFDSAVHSEFLLLEEEIQSFLRTPLDSRFSHLRVAYHQASTNLKTPPRQQAEDIASVMVSELDEKRKKMPAFSYTQDDHDKGLKRLFAALEDMGHGHFPLPENSGTKSRDYEELCRGMNDGCDFAFERVLPQLIKDYPDMVDLKASPYWLKDVAHTAMQKYLVWPIPARDLRA